MIKTVVILFLITIGAVSALNSKDKSNDTQSTHHKVGIQGGEEIQIDKRPYIVALTNIINQFIGNGALIDMQWILTAASCVNQVLPQGVVVRVGSDNAETGGTTMTVEKIVIHQKFKKTWLNNLALLKLTNRVVVGPKTEPIALGNNLPKSGENTTVAGYGPTTFSSEIDGQLRDAMIPFIPYKTCKPHYEKTKTGFSTTNFCASKKGVGACPMDRGAPLEYKNNLIGIFSGSDKDCGSAQYPGVYSDVTKFRKWIKKTIKS